MKFLSLFFLLASFSAQAATLDMLSNPGFEAGRAKWGASLGSTFVISTASPLDGGASGVFTPTATGQTVTTAQAPIPEGLKGAACSASILYKGSEATNKFTLSVIDGSSVTLGSTEISTPVSQAQRVAVPFKCPTSGTLALRITSSGAASGLKIDNAKLGKNDLIQVSQATLVGTLVMSNCATPFTNASGSFASLGTNSGCTYTVTGAAKAPSTQVAGFSFDSLQPGEYKIEYEGTLSSTANAQMSYYQFSDGTNTTREVSGYQGGAGFIYAASLSHSFTYSTAQSNVTWQIFAHGTPAIYGDVANPGTYRLYRYPTSSETAVRAETINWKVDSTLSGTGGSRVDLGVSAVGSFTGLGQSTMSLTNNAGSVAAQIPCSGTNPPTGTTCGAGTPQVGVSFPVLSAGDVEACVNFNWIASFGAGSQIQPFFTIVETPANAQTILQQIPTVFTPLLIPGAATAGGWPIRLCGRIPFASSGTKTLRLFYQQVVSGSAGASELYQDPTTPIVWEVHPITQNVPAPILVGGVTSPSAGTESIVRAQIHNPGSGTVNVISQSGSWISGCSAPATGEVHCAIASGVFSGDPACSVTVMGGVSNIGVRLFAHSTATSFATQTITISSSPTSVDADLEVICVGPK